MGWSSSTGLAKSFHFMGWAYANPSVRRINKSVARPINQSVVRSIIQSAVRHWKVRSQYRNIRAHEQGAKTAGAALIPKLAERLTVQRTIVNREHCTKLPTASPGKTPQAMIEKRNCNVKFIQTANAPLAIRYAMIMANTRSSFSVNVTVQVSALIHAVRHHSVVTAAFISCCMYVHINTLRTSTTGGKCQIPLIT